LLGDVYKHIKPKQFPKLDWTDDDSVDEALAAMFPNDKARETGIKTGIDERAFSDAPLADLQKLAPANKAFMTALEAQNLETRVIALQRTSGLIPGPSGSGKYIKKQTDLYDEVRQALADQRPVVAAVATDNSPNAPPEKGLLGKHEYAVLEAGPIPVESLPKRAVQPPGGGQILGFKLSNPWGTRRTAPGPALPQAARTRRGGMGYGRKYVGIDSDGAFKPGRTRSSVFWVELSELHARAEFTLGPRLDACPAYLLGKESGVSN
jgi:hypothetical protein